MQDKNSERNKQHSNESETKIYLTPDSTLQTPEEDEHDKNIDVRKDNSISVSTDDLHNTNADRFAGSDRAGTAERKDDEAQSES
jgi:hypothetical protein